MMVLKRLGPGAFPDPAWVGRRLHVVSAGEPGHWRVLEEDGAAVSEDMRPKVLFPRTNGVETIYSDDWHFCFWKNLLGLAAPPGRPAGNNPVAIGRNGTFYCQRWIGGEYPVGRYVDATHEIHVRYGSAMGLWSADDWDNVRLWDEARDAIGTTHEAGGIMVGERTDNDGARVRFADGNVGQLCADKWIYWPRIAMREDGRIAIAWWDGKTATGVWVWIGTEAELRAASLPHAPTVPGTPTTPTTPQPPTQPPTQETPAVNHQATVEKYRAKFPAPQFNESGQLTNPLGLANAYAVINATAYEHRAEGLGLLKKTGGTQFNNCSIDVIINPKTREAFDCLGDAEGEGRPAWNPIEYLSDFDSRFVAPTAPAVPEPEVPGPTDPGIPTPTTPPDTDLAARVTALETFLKGLYRVTPF